MNPKHASPKMAIPGTSSMRLAIVLYDQLIQDVSRAGDALAHGRPERCAAEIGHALAVIGYLHATLPDGDGRDVTHKLELFYTMLREKLMEAQVRSSHQILSELQQQLKQRREPRVMGETDTFVVK